MISKTLSAASLKPFVLSILAEEESYGYEIIQKVHRLTNGEIKWAAGTLYPLLHTLEHKGLITSYEGASTEGPGPKRKYYRLTPKGQKALEIEKQQWLNIHEAFLKLWGPSPSLSSI